MSLVFPLLIAGTCWAIFFDIIEDLLTHNPPFRFDVTIMSVIPMLRTPCLSKLMLFITYFGNWQVYLAGAVPFAILLFSSRQWWWLSAFVTSVIGEQTLIFILKFFIDRKRPNPDEAILNAVGSSFPSGHTYIGCAVYGFIACYVVSQTSNRLVSIAIAFAIVTLVLLIGISRVYLGVHWPSDVVASLALGSAWITTVLLLYTLALRRTKDDRRQRLPGPQVTVAFAIWITASIVFYSLHPL